jgi:hypothetical protein
LDARVVHHQHFIVDKPVSLYHHLTERKKGCSRTIVFTDGIDSVSKFPWITAYASNHVVGVAEVTTTKIESILPEMGQRRNFLGTVSELT